MRRVVGIAALLLALLGVTAMLVRSADKNTRRVAPMALAAILAQPLQTPASGAAAANVTVVEYFDYNCPVCRHMDPELHQLIASDPAVRVIYKDWPIFGAVSAYAAYCSFAAAAEGKYNVAHDALLNAPDGLESRADVRQALQKAGLNMEKLEAAVAAHRMEYSATLTRNQREATALGLRGTPGLIIGDRLVAGGLDLAQLSGQVAAARNGD